MNRLPGKQNDRSSQPYAVPSVAGHSRAVSTGCGASCPLADGWLAQAQLSDLGGIFLFPSEGKSVEQNILPHAAERVRPRDARSLCVFSKEVVLNYFISKETKN